MKIAQHLGFQNNKFYWYFELLFWNSSHRTSGLYCFSVEKQAKIY